MRPLLVAAAIGVAFAAVGWWTDRDSGLVVDRVPDAAPAAGGESSVARWSGSLFVPSDGVYEFEAARPDLGTTLRLDGAVTLRPAAGHVDGDRASPVRRQVWLSAGFHATTVESLWLGAAVPADLAWGRAGETLRPIASARTFRAVPRRLPSRIALERLRQALRLAWWVSAGLAAWVFLLAVAGAAASRWSPVRTRSTIVRLAIAWILPAAVVLLAAAVRFDAFTATYPPLEGSRLKAIQQAAAAPLARARPAAVRFDPAPLYPHKNGPETRYLGDPYTYLDFARNMRSFYAAHYREPLYPAAVKGWLWILDGQDAAVSFASATFSVLAVLATYLLGAAAFSTWVGLSAAAALAVEQRVVSEAVGGGRDDAFTFAVVMFAWALVRWWRAAPPPDPAAADVPPNDSLERRWANTWADLGRAATIGAVAGAACLIRITSLSFVVPGLAAMALSTARPLRDRVLQILAATAVAVVIAAPYVVNCWIAFGDPLYAINVHANVYRATEGQSPVPGTTARGYVGAKVRSRPFQTVETVLLGLTTYPFQNKWDGFTWLSPSLGTWISRVALAGLFLCGGYLAGRLVLVVLVCSLVPYAVTWRLLSDWRFTEHAYPFFLIAAMVALWTVLRGAAVVGGLRGHVSVTGRSMLGWLALAAAVSVAWWTIVGVLPPLVERETLAAGEPVSITAGPRDAAFFRGAWSAPHSGGNVTSRVALGRPSAMRFLLPTGGEYSVTLRMDPFPRPLPGDEPAVPSVQARLNGTPIGRLDLRWTPGRVGAYTLDVPRSLCRPGWNDLSLVLASGPPGRVAGIADGTLLDLWYVRVHPGGTAPSPR